MIEINENTTQSKNDNKQFRGVYGKEASYGSLPFGHGVRRCIGMKIVKHQMTYFLARLLENFTFKSENEEEVRYQMRLVGIPDRPIQISLSRIQR